MASMGMAALLAAAVGALLWGLRRRQGAPAADFPEAWSLMAVGGTGVAFFFVSVSR